MEIQIKAVDANGIVQHAEDAMGYYPRNLALSLSVNHRSILSPLIISLTLGSYPWQTPITFTVLP